MGDGGQGTEKGVSSPLSPVPHAPTPIRVLLIQAEWPARALLKAELEERGCDVLAADDVRAAIDLCVARGFRPGVTVLDTVGMEASTDDLHALEFLLGRGALIVLLSHQHPSDVVTILSPQYALMRPFSIGNVVEAVLKFA